MQPANGSLGYNSVIYSRNYNYPIPMFTADYQAEQTAVIDIFGLPCTVSADIKVHPNICHCHPSTIAEIQDFGDTMFKTNWCMSYLNSKLNDLKGNYEERDFQARVLTKEICYDRMLIAAIDEELKKNRTL